MLVKETGTSVRSAAKTFGVPCSTLRDRVSGKIDPETLKPGPGPMFSTEEEMKFNDHIKTMIALGYSYTNNEIIALASNYAVHLGKRTADKILSTKWFQCFKQRWPDLRVLKPKTSTNDSGESNAQEAFDEYFTKLQTIIEENDLRDKPECIYNIDEIGIHTEHSHQYKATVISYRPSVTTIIGCGNALGTKIPPYFVFMGKRMDENLLKGSTPGSNASMSDSGCSNSSILLTYMETHFSRHIQREDKQQPILVILDGHKSHVNVPVLDWAKENNVLLLILPAHKSHVLKPLDVGCFVPLKQIYTSRCHKFLGEHPSTKITMFNVAPLASDSYVSALSDENLRSAFKKTGIFPLDRNAISRNHIEASGSNSETLLL